MERLLFKRLSGLINIFILVPSILISQQSEISIDAGNYQFLLKI